MSTTALQCFWRDGHLVVVLPDSTEISLSSIEGIRALKTNELESQGIQLFPPDDPRRMALIQEQISGMKD